MTEFDQKLVDLERDIDDIGKSANEDVVVEPRYGDPYMSAPMVSRVQIEMAVPNAKYYLTKSELDADLANVSDGQYAMVVNDLDFESAPTADNGFYCKISGAWEFLAWNPLTQFLQKIDEALSEAKDFTKKETENVRTEVNQLQIYANQESDDLAYAITDAKGNAPFSITKEGVNQIPLVATENININGNSIQHVENPEWAWVVTDVEGRVAFGVRMDGSTYPTIGAVSTEPANIKLKKTDWIHGGTYGQSLSRGSGSYPVVSTVQPYNNLTFISGVLPRPSDTHDYTDSKPLVEQRWNPTGAEGESPTSGMLNKITELALVDGEDLVFFGSGGGQGGTRIENLSKGTTRYNEQIAMYQAAADLAQSRNLSYSVGFIGFVQGESNYNAGNTRQGYKQLQVQLKRDFDTDIQAVTNQDFVPIMLTYQTASHHVATPRRDHVNIALAQWDAHRENVDIVMACSMYAIEYLSDNLHLTADSSQQLGKYLGKAAHHMWRYVHDLESKPFRPLEPENILWKGQIIDVEFNVPTGDLTLDTTLVSSAPNHGFDIWVDDVLQETAISSVTIVDKNRVRVVLDQAYTDAVLSYARGRPSDPATSGPITGPRGNLRDQAGDVDNYLDSASVRRYMHNWCVIFQYSQTTGFN